MALVQIIDDLSCIKVVTDGHPLHIHKKLIKTIDVLHNDTVRIDIGEGALRHVYVKFADVTQPALANVNLLKDTIKGMLDADDASGATAGNQVTEIGLLTNIKDAQAAANGLLTTIRDTENAQSGNITAIKDAQTVQNNLLTDIKTAQVTELSHLNTIKDSEATQSGLLTNVRDSLNVMQETIAEENNILVAMNNLLTDIKNYVNPVYQNAFNEPSRYDESIPMVVYYGYAVSGARPQDPAWAIKKVTRNGDVFIYEWADGNQTMNHIWDDRYNLTYLPLDGQG